MTDKEVIKTFTNFILNNVMFRNIAKVWFQLALISAEVDSDFNSLDNYLCKVRCRCDLTAYNCQFEHVSKSTNLVDLCILLNILMNMMKWNIPKKSEHELHMFTFRYVCLSFDQNVNMFSKVIIFKMLVSLINNLRNSEIQST